MKVKNRKALKFRALSEATRKSQLPAENWAVSLLPKGQFKVPRFTAPTVLCNAHYELGYN